MAGRALPSIIGDRRHEWHGLGLGCQELSFLTEQISSENQQGFSIIESRFYSRSSPLVTDIVYIVLFGFHLRSLSTRHQHASHSSSHSPSQCPPPYEPHLNLQPSTMRYPPFNPKVKFFPHSPVTTSLTSPSQNPQIRPRPPSLHPPHQPLHPRPPVIRPKTHLPILPPPIPSPPNPLPHLRNPHPLSRSGPRPQRRRRWLHPRSEDRSCFES